MNRLDLLDQALARLDGRKGGEVATLAVPEEQPTVTLPLGPEGWGDGERGAGSSGVGGNHRDDADGARDSDGSGIRTGGYPAGDAGPSGRSSDLPGGTGTGKRPRGRPRKYPLPDSVTPSGGDQRLQAGGSSAPRDPASKLVGENAGRSSPAERAAPLDVPLSKPGAAKAKKDNPLEYWTEEVIGELIAGAFGGMELLT